LRLLLGGDEIAERALAILRQPVGMVLNSAATSAISYPVP